MARMFPTEPTAARTQTCRDRSSRVYPAEAFRSVVCQGAFCRNLSCHTAGVPSELRPARAYSLLRASLLQGKRSALHKRRTAEVPSGLRHGHASYSDCQHEAPIDERRPSVSSAAVRRGQVQENRFCTSAFLCRSPVRPHAALRSARPHVVVLSCE